MSATSHSMPLTGLDVVAIDTETTALDAEAARVVEIAALLIEDAKPAGQLALRHYVDPEIPVPPEATAVHGIDDARVKGQPRFSALIGELETVIGSKVLVGHNIRYDLTVLRSEYARAGKDWIKHHTLDIRLLARVVNPGLAHYGIKQLCEWLKLPLPAEKSAGAGATAVAQIYLALLPMLRSRDIRTLAEADAAIRSLATTETDVAMGNAPETAGAASDAKPLAHIDSYPYRHRVSDVMSKPVISLPGTATVREALRLLITRKISSVYVSSANGIEGIATERDILRAIDADPVHNLGLALSSVMSKPLATISESAFLYRAIGRMDRLKIRHLAARAVDGTIVGALSARDLLRQRASTAIMLGDELDSAKDVAGLSRAWAKLTPMARQLVTEDVDARTVAAVISSEICVLTRRAAQIAEARLAADGWGPPPCRYGLLVLGSAGRGESLLAADQDNAIVFEKGEPGGAEDKWFEALAGHVADILDQVGVPYCKGGVMAKNALWRHSVDGWKALINSWVRRQSPQDLLNVDIFFDGVTVHGDPALGGEIWDYAYEIGHRAPDFVKLLSEMARQWSAPFTLFGGFKLDNGRVDLKKGGIMPMFTGARVLSIRHNARARSTPDRLHALVAKGIGSAEQVEKALDGHRVILAAMLNQQLIDSEAGIPLSPRVDTERLDKSARADLKHAVQQAEIVVDLVSEGRL